MAIEWNPSRGATLGVEWEVQLIDAGTKLLRQDAGKLLDLLPLFSVPVCSSSCFREILDAISLSPSSLAFRSASASSQRTRDVTGILCSDAELMHRLPTGGGRNRLATKHEPAAQHWREQCRAVLLAANAALWQRTMRSLRLDTKKVELVRLVFSIGVTVFVSVGTFLAIRYLIGSSG